MTAIDELRRMLDERGVKWSSSGMSTTRWRVGDTLVRFDEWGGKPRLLMVGVTHSQAVEATMGPVTCHDADNREGYFRCSECGYAFSSWGSFGLDCGDDPDFAFCPGCGRRVVDASDFVLADTLPPF